MTTRWLRASLPPCVGSCSIVIIGKLMPRHAVPSLNTSKFGITGSDFIQLWAISVHCSSNSCYIQRLKPRVHEIGASPAPNPKHTIHEITRNTRNLRKQHEPMLILDVHSGPASNQSVTFCAKPAWCGDPDVSGLIRAAASTQPLCGVWLLWKFH